MAVMASATGSVGWFMEMGRTRALTAASVTWGSSLDVKNRVWVGCHDTGDLYRSRAVILPPPVRNFSRSMAHLPVRGPSSTHTIRLPNIRNSSVVDVVLASRMLAGGA